ncbi:MAG: methyltransferase domain-containing protein, partial [Proteobacteria bacterium]|nr:methyltransferase domain-containing protein [Pseudomonadota bacterium]
DFSKARRFYQLIRTPLSTIALDLVVTSDIIEHVRKPTAVFKQIRRILKSGGHHVFTVPLQHPLREQSVVRVDTTGPTDRPLQPARYHGDGKGGRSLVYTDFGADIVDMLNKTGFDSSLSVPETHSAIANRVITVVCRAR